MPALYFFIKNKLFPRRLWCVPETRNQKPEPFAISSDDLIEQVIVEIIEKQALIDGPLGAVPNLPFGHLNVAWQKFKEQIGPQDKLWRFFADDENEYGRHELFDGYVIVTQEGIGQHFLTVQQYKVED